MIFSFFNRRTLCALALLTLGLATASQAQDAP